MEESSQGKTLETGGGGGCGGNTITVPGVVKNTTDQEKEEEIRELQQHVRTHYAHANHSEALKCSQKALEKSMNHFGRLHPSTASACNNVGLMSKMLGRYEEARQNYEEALHIYGEVVGNDHASYAATLHNIAGLERMQASSLGQEQEGDEEDEKKQKEDFKANEIDNIEIERQRRNLNESAAMKYSQALEIRKLELGIEHPYTVSTRSNLGGAIAALLLQSEQLRMQQSRTSSEAEKDQIADILSTDNAASGGFLSQPLTSDTWNQAELHLREALTISIRNPRGESIAKAAPSTTTTKQGNTNHIKTRMEDHATKKKIKLTRAQKLNVAKERRANAAKNLQSSSKSQISSKSDGTETSMTTSSNQNTLDVRTISAAAAAQNLAVFLKSRADLNGLSSHIKGQYQRQQQQKQQHTDREDMYAEAMSLYRKALLVRTELKGHAHPDTVITKFSLAELLEKVGDAKGAEQLRNQILDSYNVREVIN
eukprot:CAMPEP_0184869746 /NCGR_PEP_ID=MMETSP0580-20130426/35097_1 /TAXON_ID=1118495 /ORGANISM="Dactyliosolen fragilissimus" /LENGTH=483 /DNA_ID=CAMNT_0027371415 /DNA_START=399 /DNA_END=1853 /DNA_ORIENTATION=-